MSKFIVILIIICLPLSAFAEQSAASYVTESKPIEVPSISKEPAEIKSESTVLGPEPNPSNPADSDSPAVDVKVQSESSLPLQQQEAEALKPKSTEYSSYPSFADIIEPLMPAVVNIYTVQYKAKPKNLGKMPFPEGFLFDNLQDFFEPFGMPFEFEESYSDPKAISLGSGVIIDPDGYIVTNHHVINNADEISVKLTDNTEYTAKLIGSDAKTDLALLQIEPKSKLPFVKFGDSEKARVGDWIIAVGNPYGLGGSVTTGIISSKGRDIEVNSGGIVDNFIQTDAAINRGNSGGPLFNVKGEVIGINTAIYSPSGASIGIGFSIPSNTAQHIIEQLKIAGEISRGRLDIYTQEITPELAEGLGLQDSNGALVVQVLSGGAADKAGIKSGDIIVGFSGQDVKSPRKLQILVAEAQVNKTVKVTVIRKGKRMDFDVKISKVNDDPSQKPLRKKPGIMDDKDSVTYNDITFSNLTPQIRQKLGLKDDIKGVVITNITRAKLRKYGLRAGDIILQASQEPVPNIDALKRVYNEAVKSKKKNIALFVQRGTVNLLVALQVELE